MSVDEDLAKELVAMAEEQFAVQEPLAKLLDDDPVFAAWAERVLTANIPLTLATWDEGEPPAELVAIYELADRHNKRLASIIDSYGWPGRSLVGEDGADAVWAIAQHADRHQEARHHWLRLLEDAVALGEADPRHLARLTDRVAMTDHRPQRFGTYARLVDGGEIEFDVPIDGSLEALDQRRHAIGLPPLRADLAEPPGSAPYRYRRTTPAFAWPAR